MILDALQQVARLLISEEGYGQAHQFGEKVGYERNIDLCAYAQQDAAPYEVYHGAAGEQGHLAQQYQPDNVHIASTDAPIHYGLGKKGK